MIQQTQGCVAGRQIRVYHGSPAKNAIPKLASITSGQDTTAPAWDASCRQTSRFMDQDRIDPQSWDWYGYVRNNPSSSTDPNGLWCVWKKAHMTTGHNGGASQGDCQGQGGHWDQYNTITGITQTDGVVQVSAQCSGNALPVMCGVGMTLEGFDQTLQSYTRGNVPTLDVPLSTEAQAIFTLAYYHCMHDLGSPGWDS